MKDKIVTTSAALVILIGLFYFVNKDMNTGQSLTDSLAGVSGWISTAVMFLIGKDSHITNLFK